MKALRNKITAALIALAVLTLTIIACGGNGGETAAPAATPAATPASNAGSQPTLPERTTVPTLNIPTSSEPTSEPAPEPTSAPPSVAATHTPTAPETKDSQPTPTRATNSNLIYQEPRCTNAMMFALQEWYDDPEGYEANGFGPETAKNILDKVIEYNRDCEENEVKAEVTALSKCKTNQMKGIRANTDKDRSSTFRGRVFFHPTDMETYEKGLPRIHLNFDIMPMTNNEPGCWLYLNKDLFWRIADGNGTGETGRYNNFAPECDDLLRTQIEQKAQENPKFKADTVLAAIESVQGHKTETCSETVNNKKLWRAQPQNNPVEGCKIQQNTGLKADTIVINWNWEERHHEYKPGDGSVCWIAERTEEADNPWHWTRYGPEGERILLFQE